ncbi:MAG: polysulfide reductase NrfD [Euzebyales bacterium]|nr:polysulfide reductase NrfD [Euzebyales bacterium]
MAIEPPTSRPPSATSLPLYSGPSADAPPKFAKILDQSRCIGCHACTTACKSENDVPLSVSRTYVKSVDSGLFPEARRSFQVNRCNMCEDAPCVNACPTSAMFQREDGIVDFDKDSCIGCKACIAACPYDAIFINPEDHSAEKCNFCAHRLDVGLEPACVVVCPVEAIFVGDLNDPQSKVAQTVGREPVAVRRPEKETQPKVFYKGAHQSTLDPLAAELPPGGIFAWAQQAPEDTHHINAGVPAGHGNTSQAAAILSYDVPHSVPWDWRVGLYTWTKGIAAGVYVVAAALVLLGVVDAADPLWRWVTPVSGLVFLGLTGAILVWDLDHPGRFYYIFTRPQWGSWLVRGGVIIAGYGAVLSLHLLSGILGAGGWSVALTVLGVPLAVMTAGYTAFLFAQAKARDLWQNPLLPPHFVVQSVLGGAAFLALLQGVVPAEAVAPLGWTIAGAGLIHLLMVLGELALPHGTAHVRLAVHNLTHGRFGRYFWTGVALVTISVTAPWVPLGAAVVALLGLLAHEHAYVQAAQSVPLA